MQTGSIIKLRNTLIINVYGVEQLQEWAVAAYKKKIKIINSCEIQKKCTYLCTYLNKKAHKVWHSQNNSYVDFVMTTTTAATSTSVQLFWWNYFARYVFLVLLLLLPKTIKVIHSTLFLCSLFIAVLIISLLVCFFVIEWIFPGLMTHLLNL